MRLPPDRIRDYSYWSLRRDGGEDLASQLHELVEWVEVRRDAFAVLAGKVASG